MGGFKTNVNYQRWGKVMDKNSREPATSLMRRLKNRKVTASCSVVDALEFRRSQYDLTQRDFAELLGLTPGNYGEILAGRRRLPINATKRAYAIGVPADLLLGDFYE